jgi:hypothetical protein
MPESLPRSSVAVGSPICLAAVGQALGARQFVGVGRFNRHVFVKSQAKSLTYASTDSQVSENSSPSTRTPD